MKFRHLHSTKGREPYGFFVLLVQLDFTIGEEYSDGEFPKGEELNIEDKSTILEIGKYSITSIAMYMIEFDILKNHTEILGDYYKRMHLPGAVKYAREIKGLYKSLFG